MASDKKKCVFCSDNNGKIITFVEEKLNKCKEVLNVRIKFKLKYSNVRLPDNVNTTDGYHRQCYSSFTALMSKYRNLSVTNSSSVIDLHASSSTLLELNSPRNILEITPGDYAPDFDNNIPIMDGNSITQEVDLTTESCNNIPETEERRMTFTNVCFFCKKDRKQVKGKQQALHSSADAKIYEKIIEWMTKLENYELLQEINSYKFTGATVFYHHYCEMTYLNNYNRIVADTQRTSWHNSRIIHKSIFSNIISLIEEEVIAKKRCLLLSSLCDMYNSDLERELQLQSLPNISLITNHYLEEKILKHFKKTVRISTKHKKKIIMHKDCSLLEDDDLLNLEENAIIDKVALSLRNTILNINKVQLPSEIKTNDLISGECSIPEKLERFFKIMIGGKDIRRRDGTKCNRLSYSMASDAIFCVSNGTVKPSKQITLGMAIKSLTSSRKIINILNRFGHCCNYNTLEELETEATIVSVHRSQVCPPDIVRGPSLCTGVAFDNFDRYVDTLNGKETLHDTVGIIFQNINDNTHGEYNNMDNRIDNSGDTLPVPAKRRRTFDAIIPEIIPYSKRLKMLGLLTPVEHGQSTIPENFSVIQKIDLLHMVSHFFHVPNTPMWTGFNCRLIEDNSLPQRVSYLTPINYSPTDAAVVVNTMEQAQTVGKECNQRYVQVTYDLAIAKIAFKIQATENPRFNNLFIHLGSFHLMMAFFKAIGVFINECGLSHMMIESKIIASGSVNGIIEGKHFNRCKRLHPLMAVGLQMLHFDQYLKTEELEYEFVKEQIYDELLKYKDIKVLRSTTANELLPNQILSRLLSSYTKYVEATRRGDYGKTAQYYITYIQLVNYYIILSRSIRMGDLEMYKYAITKMTNLFFIVNQPNYARWCVKYLDYLSNVNETHPGLEVDFKSGFFGIKRTKKPFSRIPIDLTLEQTINADAARRLSGISHFTNSIAARQRWTKSHSIRAALISHVLDFCGLRQLQDVTADLEPNRIKIYAKQMDDFVEILTTNLNPFDSDLDKDNLYNIASAKPVSPDIAEFLLNIEAKGENLRKQFIDECADNEDRFDKPIKKNRVLNFAAAQKKKNYTLGSKVVELRMQRDIFGRMLGISLSHKVDIEKVLTFPLTPMPTSMCHADGAICKTDKAQLVKIIEKKMGDNHNQQPMCFHVGILDGFFMLHLMKEVPQTFDGISKKFLRMITQFKAARIDIVFDQYFAPSIKDCERTRRDESTCQVSIGPNQIRPHNFTAELKNIQFKEAIVKFFINHWSTDDMAPFIGSKVLYLSFNECYSYRVENNKVIKTREDSLSCEEHEEADTRIVYHICQIDFDAEVVVRCSDSDILIILLGNMDHLNASLKIWINMGVGKYQRYININELYNILGSSLSEALPGFHAITGCDYIPAFFRKGKLRPFKLLEESEDYQLAFQNLVTNDEDLLERTFVTLEKFVCTMYGVHHISDVNDVRFYLFSNTFRSKHFDERFEKKFRNFDSSSLPPCKAELQQHLLRVSYVTKFWRNAHLKYPTSLSPLACGWTINDGQYDFVWFLGDQLPSLVADIIVQDSQILENDNTSENNDYNNRDESSDDDEDIEEASLFGEAISE